MCVSAAAAGHGEAAQTLQLVVEIQGHMLKVLIDFGSTHLFLNDKLMPVMQGNTNIKHVPVKIADGALVYCTAQIANCQWTSEGNTFSSNFRFI